MDFQKFGPVSPSMGYGTVPIGLYASEVIKAQSGRFVYTSGGYARIAGDTHATLMGFLEGGDKTASATSGVTVMNMIFDTGVLFRIPLRYDNSTYTVNYSVAVVGGKYDLIVVSNVQYCNLTTQTEGTIIVLGGQAATSSTANDGWVLCRMNPAEFVA